MGTGDKPGFWVGGCRITVESQVSQNKRRPKEPMVAAVEKGEPKVNLN